MSQQLTASKASQVTRDFGVHSMLVDNDRRTVRIYSDMNASDRACRRDWRKVCAELRTLGAKLADEMSLTGGIEVSFGTF